MRKSIAEGRFMSQITGYSREAELEEQLQEAKNDASSMVIEIAELTTRIAAKDKRIRELREQVDEIWHKYQCANDDFKMSQSHCREQSLEIDKWKSEISQLKLKLAAKDKSQ